MEMKLISIQEESKIELDGLKEYKRESYGDVVERILTQTKLTQPNNEKFN